MEKLQARRNSGSEKEESIHFKQLFSLSHCQRFLSTACEMQPYFLNDSIILISLYDKHMKYTIAFVNAKTLRYIAHMTLGEVPISVFHVEFCPSEQLVISSTIYRELRLYSLRKRQLIRTIRTYEDENIDSSFMFASIGNNSLALIGEFCKTTGGFETLNLTTSESKKISGDPSIKFSSIQGYGNRYVLLMGVTATQKNKIMIFDLLQESWSRTIEAPNQSSFYLSRIDESRKALLASAIDNLFGRHVQSLMAWKTDNCSNSELSSILDFKFQNNDITAVCSIAKDWLIVSMTVDNTLRNMVLNLSTKKCTQINLPPNSSLFMFHSRYVISVSSSKIKGYLLPNHFVS